MLSIWECKIGGPLERKEIPPRFDAVARDMLEALYEGMTGKARDFCISAWDGTLTDTQRKIMNDRYPDTPEYQ